MNAVIPTETWLHRFNDWAPFVGIMLTFLTSVVGSVIYITKQQTKKIERIFVRLNSETMDEHNRNGGAHIAVASALRAERGQLFQQIGEELNAQADRMMDNREGIARIEERLGSLIEAHNATVGKAPLAGGGGVACRVIPVRVRVADPHYPGPYRRKDDPPSRG